MDEESDLCVFHEPLDQKGKGENKKAQKTSSLAQDVFRSHSVAIHQKVDSSLRVMNSGFLERISAYCTSPKKGSLLPAAAVEFGLNFADHEAHIAQLQRRLKQDADGDVIPVRLPVHSCLNIKRAVRVLVSSIIDGLKELKKGRTQKPAVMDTEKTEGGSLDEVQDPEDPRLFKGKKNRGTVRINTHPGYNMDHQSQGCEDGSRISTLVSNPLRLLCSPEPNVHTLIDLLRLGAKRGGNGPALGHRHSTAVPFDWISWPDFLAKADTLAKAFASLSALPKAQDCSVGIWLRNSPTWLIVELATAISRRVSVPLYDNCGPEAVSLLLRLAGIQILFCDSAQRLLALAKSGPPCCLKWLIYVSEDWSEVKKITPKLPSKFTFLTFEQLMEEGRSWRGTLGPEPTADDTAAIFTTSGAEGELKGVALSHTNLVAAAVNTFTIAGVHIGTKDVCLSYLPMAHIYTRTVETMVLSKGGRIGFVGSGSTSLFIEMASLHPTIFPTVPRMLNKLFQRVSKQSSGIISSNLYKTAARWKLRNLQNSGAVTNNSIWDKVLFRKYQKELGGQVKLILTGSAPIQEDVIQTLRLVFACVVIEGYGLTETCGAVTLTNEADVSTGHVGPPTPNARIKLIDVPEMGLSSIDGKGEILVKGPIIAKGYVHPDGPGLLPLVDHHGWFHTGDIGEWTDVGCLRIIDRLKNLLKLPQGCYVAPEKLESIFVKSKWLSQVFVTGSSLKPWVVAVGVLDLEMTALCGSEELGEPLPVVKGPDGADTIPLVDRPTLCRKTGLRKLVLTELERAGKTYGLEPHEIVGAVHLRPEPFTKENGLLTPTGKLQRYELRRRFATEISALFDELEATNTPHPVTNHPNPLHGLFHRSKPALSVRK